MLTLYDCIASRFVSHKNNVNIFIRVTGYKIFSIQAFPASFRFYHCTLWEIFLSFRKCTIHLIQTQEQPSMVNLFTKVTSQKHKVIKYDPIDQNVITVATCITYGYKIGNFEWPNIKTEI